MWEQWLISLFSLPTCFSVFLATIFSIAWEIWFKWLVAPNNSKYESGSATSMHHVPNKNIGVRGSPSAPQGDRGMVVNLWNSSWKCKSLSCLFHEVPCPVGSSPWALIRLNVLWMIELHLIESIVLLGKREARPLQESKDENFVLSSLMQCNLKELFSFFWPQQGLKL